MTRVQYFDTITTADPDGTMRALSGINVTVYDRGANTKPNIYAQQNDVQPIAGSSFVTIAGIVSFWVDVGAYDIVFEDTQAPSRIQPNFKYAFEALPAGDGTLPGDVLQAATVAEDRLAQIVGSSFAAALMNRLYAPGDLKPSYQAADHPGWVLCDGRNSLVTAAYPSLSALMLAAGFAGSDGSHFGVPDLRGRALIGADAGGVRIPNNPRVLGASGGVEQHQLLPNELASHGHSVVNPAHMYESGGALYGYLANDAFEFAAGQAKPVHYQIDTSINANSGDQPHKNMQPYLTGNYFIKT